MQFGGVDVFVRGNGVAKDNIIYFLQKNGLIANVRICVDEEYFTEKDAKEGHIRFLDYVDQYGSIAPLVFGFNDNEAIKNIKNKYAGKIKYMYEFYTLSFMPVQVDEWDIEFVRNNYKDFLHTYNMLSDEDSRKCMQFYLDAASAGCNYDKLDSCKASEPYFSGALSNRKFDKFFDCGAFTGDTIEAFAQKYAYEKIYAFEPDEKNIKRIEENINRKHIDNVEIVNKGVWNKKTTLHFQTAPQTSASCICDEGNLFIDVVHIDAFFDEFTSKSLLKMDIEGSELMALQGARRVISEKHPSLIICVYHRRSDLITIPQYIESLVEKDTYDYILSYEGNGLGDLVFYAIPRT